jgi:hypothetical protein
MGVAPLALQPPPRRKMRRAFTSEAAGVRPLFPLLLQPTLGSSPLALC